MIDCYNNETRLTEILRAVVNNTEPGLGPARTREEIFVSRALGLTIWPAIPPRTTMEMWLAFIAGDTAEPAAGTYTVRTCAESCIITYARRVRGASAVVPIFVPHTHYERALAKLAGIVPLNWGVLGREWEHLMQTITVSTMPRSAVAVIGGEHVGIGPDGEISPFQDLRGYGYPWPGGGGKNLIDTSGLVNGVSAGVTYTLSSDGGIICNGTSSATGTVREFFRGSNFLPNGQYTLTGGQNVGVRVNTYNSGGTLLKRYTAKVDPVTFSIDENASEISFNIGNVVSGTEVSETVYPMLEAGTSATSWEPYENLCPIYPGLTLVRDDETMLVVWGGALDTASGILTVTDAEIASYAGETLPGEWISDRDAYAAGAVPTTGAQVVYKLTDPITYQLTRAEVQRALNCSNYLGAGVWRLSCGGVTIIHAQIRTESLVNHYDIAASNENWTFEVTVDGVTVSGASGSISVAAGDHDVVIVATPGEDTGVCIIQPTLYYTTAVGLLGTRRDLDEPEEPAEPEPEEPAEPEPEEPVEPEPEEPVEPEPEEPAEPQTAKRRRKK